MKITTFFKVITLAVLLPLIGCATASMVNAPGGVTSQFAPTNEGNRPGTIKYLNQGADFVLKKRREDAYRQMYQACNSKYKILSEGPNSEGAVATSIGYSTVYSASQYWYIQFQCESQP